ncbi:MAG: hypothetical protein ACRC1H_05905, partial [Caldilineaceae bacterium]
LGEWLVTRHRAGRARLTWSLTAQAAGLLALPLLPLLLFNLQTGGSLFGLGERIGTSYYGVNNAAVWANLQVRLAQLVQTFWGNQFWYLGSSARNGAAPWLAAMVVVAGLVADWRRSLPPLLLVAATVLLSLVTVSDLFITHYALLLPLLVGVVAVAGAAALERRQTVPAVSARLLRPLAPILLAVWVTLNLVTSLSHHTALAQTGGLGDHSDASYTLTAYLRGNGYGAPIALDWGMDATVRYLSEGAVTPIEIFGYESPAAADAGFGARVASYMGRDDAVFLLRAPGNELFAGRRTLFEQEATARGKRPVLLQAFAQRDGTPLYELWGLETLPQ